ncbi:unnamed protein product [Boreogadus saida]
MVRIQELLTLQHGAGGAVAGIQPEPSLGDVPSTNNVLSLAASANRFSEGVTGRKPRTFLGRPPPLLRALGTAHRTRRQVWLAQLPLTEACRRALRAVPVVPGELFGSAALQTLERAAQARQTNLQLSGLHRSVSAPGRPRAPPAPSHALTQREMRAYVGLGGPPSSPLITFAPPPAHRPGSLGPRSLAGTPPEAGGPGARTTGPVVCRFSQQQISYWAACTIDPWVVSTLTRGSQVAQDTARLLSHVAWLGLTSRQEAAFYSVSSAFGQAGSCFSCGASGLTVPAPTPNSLHLDAKWHRQRRVKPMGSLFVGAPESGGRLPLSTEASTGGMAASPRGGGVNVGPLRQSRGGPLCLGGVGALPPLVLLGRSVQPFRAGRAGARLAGQASLCVPTIASGPTDTPEGPFAGPPALSGGPLWAGEALVSTAARHSASPTGGDLLSQLVGQIWHPDPSRLQLWAWPLQGPTHC